MRASCVCVIVAAVCGSSMGDVVSIEPARDNTLFEESGTLSNGAGRYLFAGNTGQSQKRRAVVSFDVAGAVPPNAVVTSVMLTMYVSRTVSGPAQVSLHRITAAWGEGTSAAPGQEGTGGSAQSGDATWVHTFFPDSFWSVAGGDFAATPSAMTMAGFTGSSAVWSSPQMAVDVQAWLDDPSGCFGWILVGDETFPTSAKRFNSRQASSLRPLLTIEYELGCAADINGDGVTDSADLSVVLGSFGSSVPPGTSGDLNGDGVVDSADLSALVGDFGCSAPG